MRARIYTQALGIPSDEKIYMDVDPSDMYAQTECLDCFGTGEFDLYGDVSMCVCCKGAGYQWVSLI